MKFLKRLATGQIALWCAFWLIGTPLAVVWDGSGACMVFGCGVEVPLVPAFVIALFALASIALPFVALAIWRSASNYPQSQWWQKLVALGAKLGAAFSGLLGALSVLGLLYLAYDVIYAVFIRD
jgi:hypothetical protein